MATAGYMEQLNDPIYRLEAIAVTGDGKREPFTLTIYDGEGDEFHHFCWLFCPYVREEKTRIYGVDTEQARALAIRLVDEMLTHHGVTLKDQGGSTIKLPPYDYEVTEE